MNGHLVFTMNFALSIGSAVDNRTTDTDFVSVVRDISNQKWQRQVAAIREAYGRNETATGDTLKRQLPAILWSGTFSKRTADALIKHSGLVHVDLDNLGDQRESWRDLICADPHTLFCFTSPSGNGLKVVYRCDPERLHLDSFRAAEAHVLEQFGLAADPACKDVNRLCFVGSDEEAFLNEAAEPLDYLPERVEFKAPAETMPGHRLVAGTTPGDDYDTRGDWQAVMRKHGWTAQGDHKWRRPGKESGVSATWDAIPAQPNRLYVFSSNAQPFEQGHLYRPWHIYAVLECGGDFSRAAKELGAAGYGEQPKKTEGREVHYPGYEGEYEYDPGNAPEEPAEIRTPVKGFTLWASSQFMGYKLDTSSCLLGAGYLELGQWTSLIGIGGLGKTRLALWLVICQVLGRPWCGLPTGGVPQKSVILSTENGLRRWKEDLTKIFATLTEAEAAVVEANVRILAMTDDEDGDLCLGNLVSVARLRVTLKESAWGVVVFDPFADMMDGDENKTSDLVATLTTLRGITRSCCPKAAILLIHHARTGAGNVAQAGDNFNAGNFGRGAKALYSKVRCELQLAPEDRDNPNRLVLACGKANDTAKFSTRCMVFNEEDFSYAVDPDFDIDAWRDDVSGKRKKSTITMAEIIEFVREKCPFQGDETDNKTVIAEFEGSGAAVRTIQKYITNAIDAGYLRRGKNRCVIKLGAKPLPKN